MLKTYDLIKKLAPKLGEDEAKDLISFVEESKGEAATKADLQIFPTKADLQTALSQYPSKEFCHEVFATKADLEKQIFATKADLEKQIQTLRTELKTEIQAVRTELSTEIQAVRTELSTEIQAVRTELKVEIQAVRTELKVEIQTIKSDLLKWQFGFWATIIIAILIKGFLKL